MRKADRERMEAELKRAFSLVASTEEGRIVLQHICAVTGYGGRLYTYDPQTFEVNTQASMHNLARRTVWIDIQKELTPNQRRVIEIPIEEKP